MLKLNRVVIAYECRPNSYEFLMESAKVMASHGIKAYVLESLRPTPELSFAVRHLQAAGGILVTASHNPPEYNGYRIYDETGCQLVPADTNQLIALVDAIDDVYNERVKALEINLYCNKKDDELSIKMRHFLIKQLE